MGDWFQELAKIQIDSFADAKRITEEVMKEKQEGKWELFAGPANEASHERLKKHVEDLNSMPEQKGDEWDHATRARDLGEMEEIFKRLGIDKRIEELKPCIRRIRERIIHGVEPFDGGDIDALNAVCEFIECIDEP